MPIYTKTGDTGTTAIFGGRRLSKDAPQVHAYGDIDELDSFIGLAISHLSDKKDIALLTDIQHDLYHIMSILSGGKPKKEALTVINGRIRVFEKKIDTLTKSLPKLHNFILVQGVPVASQLHVCRAVCRRAERAVVGFLKEDVELNNTYRDLMIQYLNRLSDLLFVLARKHNKGKEILA